MTLIVSLGSGIVGAASWCLLYAALYAVALSTQPDGLTQEIPR